MSGSWAPWLLLLAGGVLLASGGLKLRDRAAFARAVDGFSVLPASVRRAARVLPAAEVALGVLLLVSSGWLLVTTLWVAIALLLALTVLVGVTLARGERPTCQCFGAAGAEPISGWTLARNVALVLLFTALGAGLAPEAGLVRALAAADDDTRSGVALLALGTLAVVVLWVRQDRLLAATGADATGVAGALAQPPSLSEQQIPPLSLTSPAGEPVQLREMADAKAQLLVYVSPTCSTCHQLAPLVSDWQELLGAELDVRLVSIGGRAETATAYPHQVDRMWFDEDEGYGRLGIPGTPSALLLGTNGTVAAGPAAGVPAIQELLATVVQALGVNLMTGAAQQSHGHEHPPGEPTREDQAQWVPEVGRPVPDLTVVREDGTVSSYADALAALSPGGGVATTLAWSHTCSWCDEVLDDVRRASARGDVVLVVSEDIATVRAQGITGPVLQVMSPATAVEAVGVPGTPGAVPVRDGVVAGLGGVGGPHVLEVIAEYSGSSARA